MQCPFCGTQLSTENEICSACHATLNTDVTLPSPVASSTTLESSSEPTLVSAPPTYMPPSEQYGQYHSQYNAIPPYDPQYNAVPPYYTMPPVPLAPQPPRKKTKLVLGIIAGVSVLLILIIIGSVSLINGFSTVITKSIADKNNFGQAVNPYTNKMETLSINDPLNDNSLAAQHGYKWVDTTTSLQSASLNGGCQFAGAAYHATIDANHEGHLIYCPVTGRTLSDFTYEVKATIQQGHCGGIIFRYATGYHFYGLLMCDDGHYDTIINTGQGELTVMNRAKTSNILRMAGATNVLAVVAHGSQMKFYINRKLITTTNNSTYTTGRIGLFAYAYSNGQTDAAFSDAKVWVNN